MNFFKFRLRRLLMRHATCLGIMLTLFCMSVGPLNGQSSVGHLAPSGLPAEAFPPPDRPVADIISSTWATEDERRSAGETQQVLRLMGIKPGMSVADVGAGSGYYTVQLSSVIGPQGVVFAQDVKPDLTCTPETPPILS